MADARNITLDANEAVASVAHRLSEVIAIYPITPSSAMGESCDEWSAKGRQNLWGQVPEVVEMQSEGGAAGAVHGALQGGALTTTFTASQGLLLMIPNMYKIAGELTPLAMHVSARALATHALSIFGDHSDVMAVRGTGFALLASASVQEAQDLAAISHAATLRSRIPFLHFFDGFRTSHEVAKIVALPDEVLRAMIDDRTLADHRRRALSPDRPMLRGSAQNPDVFFQAREASQPYYDAAPGIVRAEMERFAQLTGRRYRLFDYYGHPEAENVIVVMGSGGETIAETVDHLVAQGQRVGLVRVRLYRPFAVDDFVAALPSTVRVITVLDRTKEPGAIGDPLWLDVVSALQGVERRAGWKAAPAILAGRFGLGSKEFAPAHVKAIFDNALAANPRDHFTVGIVDDVCGRSLPVEPDYDIEPAEVSRCLFFGLGADGTVGANKSSIKIIGEETENFAQGYFVYDSKKSGAVTISHLRFGPKPIRSAYLIRRASFVACHQDVFLDRFEMVERLEPGGTFLLNTAKAPAAVWSALPQEVQEQFVAKKLRLFAIDAAAVAKECGMGRRINTVMQTCFFAISGVLPREEAIACIKGSIQKTYGSKGDEVVRRNFEAVDQTLARLHEIPVPSAVSSQRRRPAAVSSSAPDFVQRVTAVMLAGHGDDLPVSAFPPDGSWPTATSQWEKRRIAAEIPTWDSTICIQCNKCAFVCPHAAIRAKVYAPSALRGAPEGFLGVSFRSREAPGLNYTIQVAPEDCTGCSLCVAVCPAKDKSNPRHKAIDMTPVEPLLDAERDRYAFFLAIPEIDTARLGALDLKTSQFRRPLFEYSGACAGCGETPYLKLLTQLFGDRLLVANATGCSSIYGGNLPTTPWATDVNGRGPAWANSLFEDNAEFGLGIRLAVEQLGKHARELVLALSAELSENLVETLTRPSLGVDDRRQAVSELRLRLRDSNDPRAGRLLEIADHLVEKVVWIVGGDGWAYDIGFGGLDHVLASGRNVNLLVLDTEVYSNTGGQASKATPLGAAAKFATAGKATPKKDLGMMAMGYGNVYVARIAFGAKDGQTVQALLEAESYDGPSLVIAYSPCIAHGYDLAQGLEQQKRLVDSGLWPLYRFDPRRVMLGEAPLKLDSGPAKIPVEKFMLEEARFRMPEQVDPKRFRSLLRWAQETERQRRSVYEQLAGMKIPPPPAAE